MKTSSGIPFKIEDMQLDDIEEVMAIELQSFASPWTERAYRYELLHNQFSHFLVIRRNTEEPEVDLEQLTFWNHLLGRTGRHSSNSVLGYGGFWLLIDEAHISTIAVTPAWRGRGLGEFLFIGLLARAMLVKAIVATLEVRVSNQVAQNLYRKYQFQTVGMRKGYYRDNLEDALVMTSPPLQSQSFLEMLERHKTALYETLAKGTARPASDTATSQMG